MTTTITNLIVRDIRFPTSRGLDGSDAMNPDPDYSAAYVVLETDSPRGRDRHGLTFTMGRGSESCSGSGTARRAPRKAKGMRGAPRAGGGQGSPSPAAG